MSDREAKGYGYVECQFASRCSYVRNVCRKGKPPLVQAAEQLSGNIELGDSLPESRLFATIGA
jgi:hypothetical protein